MRSTILCFMLELSPGPHMPVTSKEVTKEITICAAPDEFELPFLPKDIFAFEMVSIAGNKTCNFSPEVEMPSWRF